jgi:hypothetical protein
LPGAENRYEKISSAAAAWRGFASKFNSEGGFADKALYPGFDIDQDGPLSCIVPYIRK